LQMQKPAIIGVSHEPYNLHLLMNRVIGQAIKSDKKKVRVAIEALPSKKLRGEFWKRVVKALKSPEYAPRGKEIEIVYVESPTGVRYAQKGIELEEKLQGRGAKPPRKEKNMLDKLYYIETVLRDRSLLRRIKKASPDIAILGANHAYVAGKYFGIKPIFVGYEKKEAARGVERTRSPEGIFRAIIRARERRRKARQKMMARKRSRHKK